MSDSLLLHVLQHIRLPRLPLSSEVCSNSGPLSQWCYLTTLFSFLPSIFPASGYFPISQLFPLDGQSIGTSASATNLPMNIQGWFPLGLAGLILLQSKELSVIQHHNSKASILWFSAFLIVQLSHPYMTTRKIITLTIQIFVNKVISLLFNMLSRFVIASFKGESVF